MAEAIAATEITKLSATELSALARMNPDQFVQDLSNADCQVFGVIDRLEELFRHKHLDKREDFAAFISILNAITRADNSHLRLIISMQGDFLKML